MSICPRNLFLLNANIAKTQGAEMHFKSENRASMSVFGLCRCCLTLSVLLKYGILQKISFDKSPSPEPKSILYVSGRMLYALFPIFLGLFYDPSNPCKPLLLQGDMITSSGVNHFFITKNGFCMAQFCIFEQSFGLYEF